MADDNLTAEQIQARDGLRRRAAAKQRRNLAQFSDRPGEIIRDRPPGAAPRAPRVSEGEVPLDEQANKELMEYRGGVEGILPTSSGGDDSGGSGGSAESYDGFVNYR